MVRATVDASVTCVIPGNTPTPTPTATTVPGIFNPTTTPTPEGALGRTATPALVPPTDGVGCDGGPDADGDAAAVDGAYTPDPGGDILEVTISCDGDTVEFCIVWGRDPDAWSWAVGVEIAGKTFFVQHHAGIDSQSPGVLEVVATNDGRVCMKVLCPAYEPGGQWRVVTFYTKSEDDPGRTGDNATGGQ